MLVLVILHLDLKVLNLLERSQAAWPPEKVGPISLILNQSLEPSAEAAEVALVI